MVMSLDFEPWTRYAPLTHERLSVIANIIRDVRRGTVLLHEPEDGDSEWSLGCRVYSRTCHGLRAAAQQYEWLTILEDEKPLRFGFAIGSVPFRFYRGEADDPPSHYLMTTYAELHQQQLALELGVVLLKDQILRLAVETDAKRQVSRVTLVEMDEGKNLTGTYSIPFDIERANVTPLQSRGVDLPALTLEPLAKDEEKREKRDAGAK
jgi:hypothetical protein